MDRFSIFYMLDHLAMARTLGRAHRFGLVTKLVCLMLASVALGAPDFLNIVEVAFCCNVQIANL